MLHRITELISRYIFKILSLSVFIFFFSCSSSPDEKILGTWRADSLYSFANGFSHSESLKGLDVPDYEYQKSGMLTESKDEQHHHMQYELLGKDSLVYKDTTGKILIGYKILELTDDKMVLKKQRTPLFGDKNQNMYEVRFFSRVNSVNKKP
jgi:hypothetical protein